MRRAVVARPQILGGEPGLDGHGRDGHGAPLQVVDGQDDVGEDEEAVREIEVVGGRVGQALDLAHDVVGEVPYRSAPERGQAGNVRRGPRLEAGIEIAQGIVGVYLGPATVG